MKSKFTLMRLLLSLLVALSVALSISLVSSTSTVAAPPASVSVQNIPTPQDVIGFEPGTDYKLVDWQQILKYFDAVGQRSNRVEIETIGYSTGTDRIEANGSVYVPKEFAFPPQRMIMAYVSSPNNLAKLDRYLEIQTKLADPSLMAPGEAEKLLAEAKPVVAIAASIHSTEIAGSQEMLKILYKLAFENSTEVNEILDNVILLLIPSQNPDGIQMEAMWYRKYIDDPTATWAGSGVPWLYQYYAGHDNNRDWMAFNLAESKAVGAQIYGKWFPEIIYDIHQMGNTGARLFVPPYYDPPTPAISPLLLRDHYLIGGMITTDEVAAGHSGVSSTAQYDTWYHGAFRVAPGYHNMIGILTEAASTNLASPITQTWSQLRGSTRNLADAQHRLNNFPDPWPGGEWHLSDIMDYEETAIMSILTGAARWGDRFTRQFYQMNVQGMKGEFGSIVSPDATHSITDVIKNVPYAYVIPMDQQRDPVVAAELLNVLSFQGIQVQKAEADFNAAGNNYKAGSYVVLVNQPTRGNVLALLGPQNYPDRRNPDGTAERPYDIAGWTLSMEMGVNSIGVNEPFTAKLARVKEIPYPLGVVGFGIASYGYVFGPELNNAAVARIKLLQAGFELQWVMEAASIGGQGFAPGATIVKAKSGLDAQVTSLGKSGLDAQVTSLAKSGLDAQVTSLAESLGVSFYPLAADPKVTPKSLSLPRIALYEPWSGNADQGWRRSALDGLGIPFTILRPADVAAGTLGTKFDVIVLPEASASSIRTGSSSGAPEYRGGIGDAGVAAIVAFVNNGGTLITNSSSWDFATTYLGVGVNNALSEVGSADFFCPGSVLTANVDNTMPEAFGLGSTADIYFVSNPAFNITDTTNVKPIVSYGSSGLLRSGWLSGESYLVSKVAAAEAKVGSGKVVLIGSSVTWRGQVEGSYKLLFNSFFNAVAK